MDDIVIPKAVPDFDSEKWQGTIQQLLYANVGKQVRIEYGGSATRAQQGVIYAVGTEYLLLWDEARRTYMTGDIASISSVVFYPLR